MCSTRSGHWRIRIPPDNLATFRKAVAKLGEAEKNNLDSQEVTEEFYVHNGQYGTREDVVFLINGIPVLVIECKNAMSSTQ